jgi:dTDP-4-amino-4,6-dideoxygalactose transaminase
MQRVDFNRATMVEGELDYVQQALRSGHTSGDREFGRRCERLLETDLHVHRSLLTASCTQALEMAALLLNIQPADEVIVPSFTFVSTVNAFVLRGARPVFVDIRPDTLNLDEEQLEGLITPQTKAIVPVHYAGVACEMDRICEIARRHGVAIVEDNAHGLFGKYKGRHLGTFGALATQSFHETKNITCGEGGALLINDESLIERAEILREKGTDRARFFRGQVDKYTWRDLGSSYLLSDILAAVLFAQLEQREAIQAARRRIWQYYARHLGEWADAIGIGLPQIPAHCEQSYHMFYLVLPSEEDRRRFIDTLRDRGIQAVFHYQPLHLSPMGREWGSRECELPVTERIADTLVRLPFHTGLSDEDLETVCEATTAFRLN